MVKEQANQNSPTLTPVSGFYGVPLGPLAISSLAFSFKNKSRGFHKRVCNLDILKNARLEIARVRDFSHTVALSLPRTRILEPRVF